MLQKKSKSDQEKKGLEYQEQNTEVAYQGCSSPRM